MSILLSSIKKLPDSPGVYFFKKTVGKKQDILYIGKATSLRDRVRSYFAKDLLKTRSMLIADMVTLADTIDYEKTDSVLEALILEAELIKKHQPKYNTKEKDNKSFTFAVITDEEFPMVSIVRGRDLEYKKVSGDIKVKYQYGPFLNGLALKEALKIIRKIFTYRDEKCVPHSGKPCFNYQLGLCPGPCVDAVTKTEYARTIQNIHLFFQGKKAKLIIKLKKEMKEYAKALEFEKADVTKRQIFSLQHIKDSSLIREDLRTESIEMKTQIGEEKDFRIEAYDSAHIQGDAMTGVMVVIENGVAKKSDYRMFKIRRKGINDVASLKEVLTRRLKHTEWPTADLIAVDGGVAQYNAAKELINPHTPIVGVVKNEKHRPERMIGLDDKLIKKHQKAILLANSEAHRFTLKYHRNLRSKNMFN
jgi:excinuclease UvrABC nuclease subunit